jgi:hypothetical protein
MLSKNNIISIKQDSATSRSGSRKKIPAPAGSGNLSSHIAIGLANYARRGYYRPQQFTDKNPRRRKNE